MEIINISEPDTVIRIVSYNCRSVKNSVDEIRQLCNKSDFVLLQEHWLLPNDLGYLNNIHHDFIAYGSSAVDMESNVLIGRPYGGTAILLRRKFSACVKLVVNSNKRITPVVLKVVIGEIMSHILLASVYMPVYDPSDNLDSEFEDVCGSLNAIITDCNVSAFVLCGDFNYKFDSTREKIIDSYLSVFPSVSADKYYLDPSNFTFVSDCHGTVSWVDHVIVNQALTSSLSNFSVLYDYIASDHKPVSFNLIASVSAVEESKNHDEAVVVIDWKAASQVNLNNYASCVNNLLNKQKIALPSLCCTKNCSNINHRTDIDLYLQQIRACINEAASRCIPMRRCKRSDFCVSGWNELVADKHAVAREAFLEWVLIGRPRVGWEYEMMKRTRAQFKLALRICRQNEDQLRCDALAQDYLHNSDDFWKKVKLSTNGRMTKHSNVVGNATDDISITQVWKDFYANLYSHHENNDIVNEVAKHSTDIDNDYNINVADVLCSINSLKCGKACGPDGIAAEAIKFGGNLLVIHLTLLFGMFVSHCYIPQDLSMTTIVPMLKNKAGDHTDVNNYRAIALANCICKLLESVILNCFLRCDEQEDMYQFGFKRGHSTVDGCFVLKSTIDYYRKRGSHVFISLLDLSKAFDCVNHNLLFERLVRLELPCNLTCFLAYWYSSQLINVRWKTTVSDCFHMRNGTRQGSILSPYLFSVYMRDISRSVINCGIGCHIGSKPCNILMYADDIVILAPSWQAQQNLLNLCVSNINKLSMSLNIAKTVTVIFSPYKNNCRLLCLFPRFELGGLLVSIVPTCKYLGHWLSSDENDNVDITYQTRQLFARTNFLIRRFAKCSYQVKLCLFRAYCMNFHGVALWNHYSGYVIQKFQAAYNKCIKLFFGYERRDSMTGVFFDLNLQTSTTILHNAKHNFTQSVARHVNALVRHVYTVCNTVLVC